VEVEHAIKMAGLSFDADAGAGLRVPQSLTNP
jgi:hypothetical protein